MNMRWAPASVSVPLFAAPLLLGCQSAAPHPPDEPAHLSTIASEQSPSAQPPAPPAVPGPNFDSEPGPSAPIVADISGLTSAQIDTMFDAAVKQARPSQIKAAVCVGMQGLGDRVTVNAPAPTIARLSAKLRLPAFPASQCSFGVEPIVIKNGAKAILYTVRVEARDADGILTFWGGAAYGNLGANGTQYRLRPRGEDWEPVPTGTIYVS